MSHWYHSGIEAYCKSSAQMLFVMKAKDDRKVTLRVCRDLLPDRTLDSISRVWTLSNSRRGRGSRQSIFEENWLGGLKQKNYRDEATGYCRLVREAKEAGKDADAVDVSQFKSIVGFPKYMRNLLQLTNNEEREALADIHCAQVAVSACVEDIVAKTRDVLVHDRDEGMPAISLLVGDDDFTVKFYSTILLSLEQGFYAEPYPQTDARQFSLSLTDKLELAHRCINTETPETESFQPFEDFLTMLIAGIIYGPTHPLALGLPGDPTDSFEGGYDGDQPIESKSVRATQIFDADSKTEGFSQTLNISQLAFFGRSAKAEEYLDRCKDLFAGHTEILETIDERDCLLFPISEPHIAVGNVHGMLLFDGGSWRYYDLDTKNGTSIQLSDGIESVQGSMRVHPGDLLRLGAPTNAKSTSIYWNATVIRIALCAELES